MHMFLTIFFSYEEADNYQIYKYKRKVIKL